MSEILGVAQSEVLIRDAIIAGFADLRNDPALLDYVFASYARDDLTSSEYGSKYAARAKDWFLKTDVTVFMSFKLDEARMPSVSISLQESSEAENTLGDVHYVPVEDLPADWPILVGPFYPTKYMPSSGMMVIPTAAIGTNIIGVGMFLYDRVGNPYMIQEVLDDDTISIQPGIVADFGQATIKSPAPQKVVTVEGSFFRETYQVGCHVTGETEYLTWLHSIVVFSLLRYKQAYLEARGLERTTFASLDFQRNAAFENEVVYSRSINVTGFVRQTWPKYFVDKIETVDLNQMVISPIGDDNPNIVVDSTGMWVPRQP